MHNVGVSKGRVCDQLGYPLKNTFKKKILQNSEHRYACQFLRNISNSYTFDAPILGMNPSRFWNHQGFWIHSDLLKIFATFHLQLLQLDWLSAATWSVCQQTRWGHWSTDQGAAQTSVGIYSRGKRTLGMLLYCRNIKQSWFTYFLCIQWPNRCHIAAISFLQSLKTITARKPIVHTMRIFLLQARIWINLEKAVNWLHSFSLALIFATKQ